LLWFSDKDSSVFRPLGPLFAEAPFTALGLSVFITFFGVLSFDVVFGDADPLLGHFLEFRISSKAASAVTTPVTACSAVGKDTLDDFRNRVRIDFRLRLAFLRIFIDTSYNYFGCLTRLVDLDEGMFMVNSFFAGFAEVEVLAH